jgi:D-alanyl-D-alanine carboxypeptidase (penicillin-binding protein 5/6)
MKIIKYICAVIFTAVILAINISAAPPDIISEAVILMDADSGQVLFEKNMRAKMYPASMTKVMTALLALEKGNLRDIIEMSHEAVESVGRDTSHIALAEGERLTLEQALYAAAIESGNDASNGIAELIGGSMQAFAAQMTARARELGALNTNFTNAHGLPDAAHYTTAYDMALIMSAAIKIREFNNMFSAVLFQMPPTNMQPDARVFNRVNSLIEGPNIIAEKIGPQGPLPPLAFSKRIAKKAVLPESAAGNSIKIRRRRVKRLWGKSSP